MGIVLSGRSAHNILTRETHGPLKTRPRSSLSKGQCRLQRTRSQRLLNCADPAACRRRTAVEAALRPGPTQYSCPMVSTLPEEAGHSVESYLRVVDRLLPGAVTACAVGGSIALDAYRPGRSDIDVIAVLSDEWKDHRSLMARLRLLHLAQVPRLTVRAARGLGFSACCNTVFVWQSEISRAVTEIHPVASHVGEVFDSQGRVRRQSGDLEGTRRRRHLRPRRPRLGQESRLRARGAPRVGRAQRPRILGPAG